MSPRSRSALVRYLDKVRSLYPAGIPKSCLKPSQSVRPLCSFIVISPSGALSAEDEGLVDSIRAKALKVEADQCSVIVYRSESEVVQDTLQAPVSILFGASSDIGRLSEDISGVLLRTHGLSEMQHNQAMKREVWGHLKSVLPYIPGS